MPVGQAVALSGLQKSALLLIQIGKDRAARVMQEMSDEEVELLSAEIMRMSNVPREISADIIDEFYENTMAMSAVRLGSGGMDYAQKVLEQTFGKEKAAEIMEKLMQGMQGQRNRHADSARTPPNHRAYLGASASRPRRARHGRAGPEVARRSRGADRAAGARQPRDGFPGGQRLAKESRTGHQ